MKINFYFVRYGECIGYPNWLRIRIPGEIASHEIFSASLLPTPGLPPSPRPDWLTNEVCDRIGYTLAHCNDKPQCWGVFHEA